MFFVIFSFIFIQVEKILVIKIDDPSKNQIKFIKKSLNKYVKKYHKKIFNGKDDEYSFNQPTFKHPKLDTTKFNYEGECREPFKYKKNNKRDLIFHSYHFKSKRDWFNIKNDFKTTFDINNSGIPYATKVFITYGNLYIDDMNKTLQKYGYKVIRSDIPLNKEEYLNVAVYRYFDFEKYLLKHKDEYDRVAITDVRDVYWFADGFQTIDPNELIVIPECDDFDEKGEQWCRKAGDGPLSGYNNDWIKNCFGEEILKEMEKTKPIILNSGFVAGSTKNVLKFLRVYNQFMMDNIEKFDIWGFDQSAMTVANYLGLFKDLNLKLEKNTQRIGNDMRGRYKYDKEEKVLYMLSKKCSPVVRHKVENIDA